MFIISITYFTSMWNIYKKVYIQRFREIIQNISINKPIIWCFLQSSKNCYVVLFVIIFDDNNVKITNKTAKNNRIVTLPPAFFKK